LTVVRIDGNSVRFKPRPIEFEHRPQQFRHVCFFRALCTPETVHRCMQDLGNSFYFVTGQRQVMVALVSKRNFRFDEIEQTVERFNGAVDLMSKRRRNAAIIFRRRAILLLSVIVRKRGGTNRVGRHSLSPFFVRYRTQRHSCHKGAKIELHTLYRQFSLRPRGLSQASGTSQP